MISNGFVFVNVFGHLHELLNTTENTFILSKTYSMAFVKLRRRLWVKEGDAVVMSYHMLNPRNEIVKL